MAAAEDRIEPLPPSLIDKIAAGEIIERPASVVKELVENALDAAATQVTITIENAGFSLIRISDNGRGMSADNLVRSVDRHTTSKIHCLEDIYALSTMGFRGEALASIGAVSRMSILSSNTMDGLGNRIDCINGKASEAQPVSHGRGTTVEVSDLFFNTPARKKFMKSERAERLAVSKCIEELIVPFCSVHFTLVIDGKKVLDAPPVADLRERIGQISGMTFARALVECPGSFDGISARIFVSAPDDVLSQRPRFQSLYVNNRRIDSDVVTFSLRNAYKTHTRIDSRPSFFCFLDVDPHRIDVNVHPTKQKIKFDNERAIGGGIFRITAEGIGAVFTSSTMPDGTARFSELRPPDNREYSDLPWPIPLQTAEPRSETALDGEVSAQESGSPVGDDSIPILLPFVRAFENHDKMLENQQDASVQLSSAVPNLSWDLISCVQIHGLFILVQIKNGILLIDQHAAHERILFELALESFNNGYSPSQQLLFPVTVELTPTEKTVVLSSLDYFARFGYEIQELSGNTIAVTATPAVSNVSAAVSVREMVAYLLDERAIEQFAAPQMRFAAAFACGNAIKQGQELTAEEMNALLNNLFAAKNPFTCPHGRPTVVRISTDELKRRFLRST